MHRSKVLRASATVFLGISPSNACAANRLTSMLAQKISPTAWVHLSFLFAGPGKGCGQLHIAAGTAHLQPGGYNLHT
eukprot:1147642-Pelagomonas_calceolata.AAC.2